MKGLLVFTLFAAMMCWFMFSPIYKHVLIVRQAVLQQEVDYMLEIAANGDHGYIDAYMLEESKQRLARFGIQPEKVDYEVASTNGSDAMNASVPLPRGVGLSLTLSYPVEGLFEIDRLIGVDPVPADARMRATGLKMSEYVP